MKVIIEKYWPIIVTSISTVAFFLFTANICRLDSIVDSTIQNSLNISGTLIGFFLTIFTILSTIKTRRMQFIKEAGLFPRVNQYLVSVIVWHIVNISLILFVPIIDSMGVNSSVNIVWKGSLIFVVIYSWTLSIRFTSIFIKLLKEE